MNGLTNITGGGPLTMSSREIAELTGKRHDHVMRDIRTMLVKLRSEASPDRGTPKDEYHREDRTQYKYLRKETMDAFMSFAAGDGAQKYPFESSYTDPQNGQSYPCFELPKRETLILISGYSIPLRSRIIDRLEELEGRHQPATQPNLNDPSLLRHLLLENVEKVIALESKVEEMRPAVEALEQIAEANGSFNRTETAKHLGIPPHVLIKWMRTNGWTYRRPCSRDDIAYQSKIVAGYLEHKVSTGPRPDGTEWISTQIRVTPKGLTMLAKAFPGSARAAA
jgi:phage regulator Rha-like protein/phage antirepressor YoqD-like protein